MSAGISNNPPVGRQAVIRRLLDGAVTVGSVFLCLLLLPARFPGMEMVGIAPNWLLMWVVAWSVKRSIGSAAIAGVVLGLLQDGMSADVPTRAISFAIVGILTARLQQERVVQDDFISVMLIVFGMTVLAETVTAVQFSVQVWRSSSVRSFVTLDEIWQYYQQVTLASAVLTSLWAPAVYYPLDLWWERSRD